MAAQFLSWFAQLQRATFRRQLTVVVAAGVLLMGVASAILSSWQGSLLVRATMVQQGLNLSSSLAQQCQLALLTDSAENAKDPIDRAFSFADVLRVELLRRDGKPFVVRGKSAVPVQDDWTFPSTSEQMQEPRLESETEEAWSFVAPVYTRPAEASPFETAPATAELVGYVRIIQGKAALSLLVRRLIVINFGVGLVLSGMLLWFLRGLARRLTQPLGALSEVMEQAGAGSLGLRAKLEGPSDIASMAQAFNGMMAGLDQRDLDLQAKNSELASHAATMELRVAERTRSLSDANADLRQALEVLSEAEKQLVAAEKLASLGRLVAGVAHELNTPLGNALMSASTLESEHRLMSETVVSGQIRKSDFLRMLANCTEGSSLVMRNVTRAAEIVRGFKQLAVDQSSEMRREFLADEVIKESMALMQAVLRDKPVRVELDLQTGLRMDSYPGPLGQVINNIVQNALLHGLANVERGELRLQCHELGEHQIQIVCSDNGAGMTPEVRERIFEAFFTTRFGQGGSGLGMQIVHSLVSGVLGGRIHVESEAGKGARVLIELPRVAPLNAPQ